MINIWIRSQDKTILCKPECLNIGKNAFSKWCIYSNYIELGAYNSEEECIYVLDIIQKMLEERIDLTCYTKLNFVYEMPKLGDKE